VYFHDRKHDGIPGCIRNLSALCRQITDLEGHQAIVIMLPPSLSPPTVYEKPPSHPNGWRAKSDKKAGQVATHLLADPVPLSDLLLIY